MTIPMTDMARLTPAWVAAPAYRSKIRHPMSIIIRTVIAETTIPNANKSFLTILFPSAFNGAL